MTDMDQRAINYAKALFSLDVPEQDLSAAKDIICKNPELAEALRDPSVKRTAKHNIIDRIFPVSVRNFLKLLIDNGSSGLISEIHEHYMKIKAESDGKMSAELVYCDAPSEAQLESIKAKLLKQYGKKSIELKLTCDKSLIGGFIIKTADEEIDRSIKGRLTELSQKLIRR